MIPTAFLDHAGIELPRLGYGTAGLFHLPSRRERRRLLDEAVGSGCRYFDTAPMYGLGAAEPELGAVMRGRRDQFVVATKFGIDPTGLSRAVSVGQAPLRRLLNRNAAAAERARSSAAGPASGVAGRLIYRSIGYDADAARQSLERSLRRLRTEYVDLLLLHDPVDTAVGEEVLAYLAGAREAGLVRAWGIAGEPQPTAAVAASAPSEVPVLQTRYDILSAESERNGRRDIAFGSLGSTLEQVWTHVASDDERMRRWSDSIGRPCTRTTLAQLLLCDAVTEPSSASAVLFSTTKSEHLRSALAAFEIQPTELERFRALVRGELA